MIVLALVISDLGPVNVLVTAATCRRYHFDHENAPSEEMQCWPTTYLKRFLPSHSAVPVHNYYVIVLHAGNQCAVKSRFRRELAEIHAL